MSEVKTLVVLLQKLSKGSDVHKYKFAKVLMQAFLIHWESTVYKSFGGMIKQELTNSSDEIHTLIYSFSCMQKCAWFNEAAQLELIQVLGWKRFVLAIQKETEKLDQEVFKKKYKDIPHYKLQKTYERKSGADRSYGFSLPESHADQLDGILMQHGMTIINGRRHGVRDSVISFLDTL